MQTPIKSRTSKTGLTTPHRLPEAVMATPLAIDSGDHESSSAVNDSSTSLSSLLPDLSTATGTGNQSWKSIALQTWSKWQRRLPVLKKLQQQILKLPPRFRWAFVVFWFGWKIILAITMIAVFLRAEQRSSTASSTSAIPITEQQLVSKTRILYIVTTLSEYNTGHRATTKGQDRLGEILIPVLVDSVETMVQPPFDFHVDVFLICAYSLAPEREQQIRQALPTGVGLQIWDSAAPLGYELKHSPTKVIDNTRALARQHRYVIKDKFPYYDHFLAFEDDMRITGHHIQHFLAVSKEINLLREQAPSQSQLDEGVVDVPENIEDYHHTKFYGDMTKEQLARVIPGFVRVEVLVNNTEHGAQTDVLPIERDFLFPQHPDEEIHVDPTICCHVHMTPNVGTPMTPNVDDVVIWETNIKGFSLRQLPSGSSLLDWVILMMGPGKRMESKELLGGYWSGREGAFGDEDRPSGGAPTLIAQQGGWMLTREQIFRMNNGLCFDTFLPPFDEPTYSADGQESMNVEFWSGSYQIFTGVKGGCNMQRIMSIHPDHFSKHLIYHVANNKQRQLTSQRMVRADHLFGQLNTVQKMAQRTKEAKS